MLTRSARSKGRAEQSGDFNSLAEWVGWVGWLVPVMRFRMSPSTPSNDVLNFGPCLLANKSFDTRNSRWTITWRSGAEICESHTCTHRRSSSYLCSFCALSNDVLGWSNTWNTLIWGRKVERCCSVNLNVMRVDEFQVHWQKERFDFPIFCG